METSANCYMSARSRSRKEQEIVKSVEPLSRTSEQESAPRDRYRKKEREREREREMHYTHAFISLHARGPLTRMQTHARTET